MLAASLHLTALAALAVGVFLLTAVLFDRWAGRDAERRVKELCAGLLQDNALTEELRGRIDQSQKLIVERSSQLMDLRRDTDERDRAQVALERRLARAVASSRMLESELAEEKERLSEHDSQVAEMAGKLAATEAARAATSGQSEHLRRDLGEYDARRSGLEHQLLAAQKSAAEREIERSVIDQDLKQKEREVESARRELAGLRDQAAGTQQILLQLSGELTQLSDEEADLGRGSVDLMQKGDRCQSLLDLLTTEIKQAEVRQVDLEQVVDRAREEEQKAETRGDALHIEIDRLEVELDATRRARLQAQSAATALQAEVIRLERARDTGDERRRALSDKLGDLRHQVERMELEKQGARAAIATRRELLATARAELTTTRDRAAALESELTRHRATLAGQEELLAARERDVAREEALWAEERDAHRQLQGQIDSQRRELDLLEAREADSDNRVRALQTTLAELETAARQSERDVALLVGEKRAAETEVQAARATQRTVVADTREAALNLEGLALKLRSRESQARHTQELLLGVDSQLASLAGEEAQLRRVLRECQNDMEILGERLAWIDLRRTATEEASAADGPGGEQGS